MEIKILQVFYDKNGLPYKDKERTVHYPITSGTFLGASNTTQIRFYYDQLDELNESTFVAISKLPNGRIGSEILESEYDSELEENYAVLNLSQFYTQYKGDVYISLQGYEGGVRVEQDENGIYSILGTPTIQVTGSIRMYVAYAPTFIGSGQIENVTLQRVLAELSTKLGIRQETLHVEELPIVGNPNVWYVVNDDPNDTTKANIYIWNAKTQTYVWVGDNTLNLGDYYTQEQGEQFEQDVRETIGDGSPKGVYATLSDLETAYPTGTNGIYVVSASGHWYYWNGSAWTDGGVYQATQLSSENQDILDKSYAYVYSSDDVDNNLTDGYYIISNGNLIADESFATLQNVRVYSFKQVQIKLTNYYSSGGFRIVFRAKDNSVISSSSYSNNQVITIPDNTYTLSISFTLVNDNTFKLLFVNYNKISYGDILDNKERLDNIQANVIENRVYFGNNLSEYLQAGKYVQASSGQLINESGYNSYYLVPIPFEGTKELKIKVSSPITSSGAGFAVYDNAKSYLRGMNFNGSGEYTLNSAFLENAKYISFCMLASSTGSYMFTTNDFTQIYNNEVEIDKLKTYTVEYNLDTSHVVEGYLDSNGEIIEHDSYVTSDYFDVKAFKEIKLPCFFATGAKAILYDENKAILSVITGSTSEIPFGEEFTITIPSNCSYFRTSINIASYNAGYFYLHGYLAYVDLVYENNRADKKGVAEVPCQNIIENGGMMKIFRTVGCIGDSLASGEMAYGNATGEGTTQYVDMYEYSWLSYMARYCGFTEHNFSQGGQSTRSFLANLGGHYTDFVNPNNKCQAYFIALGHNDYNYVMANYEAKGYSSYEEFETVYVGSSSDVDVSNPENNPDTFYGNYGKIISAIKTICPKAKIFCITMKDDMYQAYNDAIRDMKNIFTDDVYIIDMNTYCNKIYYSWEYTQGHGNAMGYLNYSYQISSYADYIIRHNRIDFKYVQFINTDKEQYIPN